MKYILSLLLSSFLVVSAAAQAASWSPWQLEQTKTVFYSAPVAGYWFPSTVPLSVPGATSVPTLTFEWSVVGASANAVMRLEVWSRHRATQDGRLEYEIKFRNTTANSVISFLMVRNVALGALVLCADLVGDRNLIMVSPNGYAGLSHWSGVFDFHELDDFVASTTVGQPTGYSPGTIGKTVSANPPGVWVNLDGALPGANATLVVSKALANPSVTIGLPFPIPYDPWTIYVSLASSDVVHLIGEVYTDLGNVGVFFPLIAHPSLVGLSFFCQWFVVAPYTALVGATEALELQLTCLPSGP